ncbi:MAG: glycoside hydrolase family 36 protein [Verrucomicrobiota bacterium]
MKPANPIRTLSKFRVADMTVSYLLDQPSQRVGLTIIPSALARDAVARREFLSGPEVDNLPAMWQPVRAWNVDSLVQVKLAGENGPAAFAQGRTMRGSPATQAMKFVRQRVGKNRIVTVLKSELGFRCEHTLNWRKGERAFRVRTKFVNASRKPLTLEMLSSFSLGGITPFAAADAPEQLRLHRFRSAWSAEGRLETRSLEDLQLERSWVGWGVASERFGQIGSMPVNGFFPFAAVEDTVAGVTWAAQLAWPGSWQMEIYRRDDCVNLSGGLADREFGHWWKTIASGGSFETPEALLTVTAGNVDAACERLTASHRVTAPKLEDDLPVMFNEWCDSWGNPSHAQMIALADRLRGSEVRYLVIDDGWAERPGGGIQQNGDWIVNRTAFPQGLRATADAIRKRGLIPGLWFEFEVVNEGAKVFTGIKHQLHRDGRVIQVGNRRFWDFRDPWVVNYLSEKVIRLLKENRLGYLKVDYNDTIGIGCDGAESPGEGLRQHLAGVQNFFRKIRRALPQLVIENCSSGGHRLEPAMLELTSLSSFSDAHETLEIPIIAANVQRLVQPRQSQIWAVLRAEDDARRLHYSLAATFLGRMCLSGNVASLAAWQWELSLAAQRLYRRAWPVIKSGVSRRHGPEQSSYRHQRGWQAVARVCSDGDNCLAVLHTFARPGAKILSMPLPPGTWRVGEAFAENANSFSVTEKNLLWQTPPEFSGAVLWLERQS